MVQDIIESIFSHRYGPIIYSTLKKTPTSITAVFYLPPHLDQSETLLNKNKTQNSAELIKKYAVIYL